jgi:hypothetical protein
MNKWNTFKVSSGGRTGVFRVPESKPTQWDTLPLSEEISISWNYEGDMPDKSTQADMDRFEEALSDIFSAETSMLVLVMTVGGLREWCIYAQDYGRFMQELNTLLAGKSKFPITIIHSHDPSWRYWHSFTDRLNQQTS